MKEKVTAIFDIGKTNKKLMIFNQELEVLHSEEVQFEEITDEDGDDCEDVEKLEKWLLSSFQQALENGKWDITAVNVATYGASFVNVDENGKAVTPLYNYLKPFPEELKAEFYKKYGPQQSFCTTTASPDLGMLNSGLQLYWLKHRKPKLFEKIKYSLHLPQYCAFLLSGKKIAEMTSIGCHTYLWDFEKGDYHKWVSEEGIAAKFPDIQPSDSFIEIEGKDHPIKCGIGVHDSSAALIPYLMNCPDPFVLLSTGTWSIAFNPFSEENLTEDHLAKDCLNYINYKGGTVKAARLFLGNEHEFQTDRLARHFQKPDDYFKTVEYDRDIFNKLAEENNHYKKFFPETMKGTGPFPQEIRGTVNLDLFDNYEEAYHQLMLDLAYLQSISIDLAIGKTDIKKMFFSGGFHSNKLFVKLLCAKYPDIEFYSASVSKATALGAALLINKNHKENLSFKFDLHLTDKSLNIGAYRLFE
ncbi:FGGY-family carbohydrate kinase [Flexithrix dorotheae]|uniref:FGGY-family carbohydrate kinase n=1 Tax=Flexithrix dorotheae TaxID=70993 RepID=UPI000369C431|nr:FGGY family carbohydrate kinase [Flexithrix dorotheae]